VAFFSSGAMGGDGPERLFVAAMRSDGFRVFAEASRGRGFLASETAPQPSSTARTRGDVGLYRELGLPSIER
jgi:hypothetical protein